MCLREACVFCLQCLFGKTIELCLIGLQNAGKTTFVNVIATGDYCEDMIPTVGLNIREFIMDDVEIKCWDLGGQTKIKCWDLGGQPRFRNIWHRYCGSATVSAIVYVVDAADHANLRISKSELHYVLSQSLPKDIPLLVLGNKIDKAGALSEQALIDQMGLESISDREVRCFMISCKNKTNIDNVIDRLIQHSRSS